MNSSYNQTHFEIDQLRKDKIIYAVEACAVITVCLFGFLFSSYYFTNLLKDMLNTVLFLVAMGFTLFMGIGNLLRLKTIKKLEKKLS